MNVGGMIRIGIPLRPDSNVISSSGFCKKIVSSLSRGCCWVKPKFDNTQAPRGNES